MPYRFAAIDLSVVSLQVATPERPSFSCDNGLCFAEVSYFFVNNTRPETLSP